MTYTLTFKYPEVFKQNCALSQFITVVSVIHSNLTLCRNSFQDVIKDQDRFHPDAEMYFLGNLLGHTREAVLTIDLWTKIEEIKSFFERNNLTEDLVELERLQGDFPKTKVGEFLIAIRNRTFHYAKPKPDYVKNLIEIIESNGRDINVSNAKVTENYHLMTVGYSSNIISGLITGGYETPEQFKVDMENCTPLTAQILHICSEAIVHFLYERGAQISEP